MNDLEPDQKSGTLSKSEVTRHRILQAARDVFTVNSFQAAGIRAVAEKAGVRHPLVVHYFKSKAALFETVSAQIQVKNSFNGFDQKKENSKK